VDVTVFSRTGLRERFTAFVAERYPLALGVAGLAFDGAAGKAASEAPDALRAPLRAELERRLARDARPAGGEAPAEVLPGAPLDERLAAVHQELVEACDGFLHRAAIVASFSAEERCEMLSGMILTRAVDNRLKAFSPAARCATASKPSRARVSVPWARRRSTPRRCGCGAAPNTATRTAAGAAT
jgi:hypothetical protein